MQYVYYRQDFPCLDSLRLDHGRDGINTLAVVCCEKSFFSSFPMQLGEHFIARLTVLGRVSYPWLCQGKIEAGHYPLNNELPFSSLAKGLPYVP